MSGGRAWPAPRLFRATAGLSSSPPFLLLEGLVSSATTLTLGEYNHYTFNGTTGVWTLPAIVGSVSWPFWIKNRGSGNLTIQTAGGSDKLYLQAGVTSFVIQPAEAYFLYNDGTFWDVE